MSGAMSSPLGAAILQGVSQANGGGMPGAQQGPQPGMAAPGMAMPQPGLQTPIPLSSMLANNATALQLQNPTKPWYAIPGMFQQPAPNPAASGMGAAPTAAASAAPVNDGGLTPQYLAAFPQVPAQNQYWQGMSGGTG